MLHEQIPTTPTAAPVRYETPPMPNTVTQSLYARRVEKVEIVRDRNIARLFFSDDLPLPDGRSHRVITHFVTTPIQALEELQLMLTRELGVLYAGGPVRLR
jgi:hypothetical protein